MTASSPDVSPPRPLLQAFCPTCRRTAYVRDDAEMACPVCSSPLLAMGAGEESQAS